jgi:glutaredoxin
VAERLRVIIYSRPGCHLCEEAKEAMHQANCADLYTLEEKNIEDDAELLRCYGNDIPVVTIDGVEAFRHRLTAEAFAARIRRSQTPSPGLEVAES